MPILHRWEDDGRHWLLIRRSISDPREKTYYFVFAPKGTTLQEMVKASGARWQIELAFKLLKRELGLHLWWAATPVLVLQQLLAALILAQVLHALQLEIAAQAQVDPFEVSFVERGRLLGLIRPSSTYYPSRTAPFASCRLTNRAEHTLRPTQVRQTYLPSPSSPSYPNSTFTLVSRNGGALAPTTAVLSP